jgi:Kef-type K+ transport system membrane component KefB
VTAALLLMLQLAVIIIAARIFGALFQLIRQTAVVGEMVAGIVLGPSILGHLFPLLHGRLFPAESRDALNLIAQVGVLAFMFVVGTRVELDVFRRHTRTIAAVSAAGILTPFLLGGALAFFLHDAFASSIPRVPFVLFVATAMSATAFPVLARITIERKLDATVPGKTALLCAAINDLVAWVLVGSVVGLIGTEREPVSLAVHGVFIAFSAGVACAVVAPRLAAMAGPVEAPASRLLLPVFFVLTGLRTDLRLLTPGDASLIWCLLIVVIATIGKMGGTMAAAVASGMPRAQAFTVGALMNTRGLMELVVLNIGYELGLLPPEVFAMMVVMALVTTCAAGPLVDWSAHHARSSARVAP